MKHTPAKLKGLLGLIACMYAVAIHAQDTVYLRLPDAEKIFIDKNLDLLAERYNIDIAKANVIQARLFENPTLSLSGNLYDPQHGKVFNVSNKNGQYSVGLQQLIRLAGKRNKEVKLAETAVTLSDNAFEDLLRTLRFSLRSTFYDLYYTQQTVKGYARQLINLEKLSDAYDALQLKQVVSLKDAVRIRSLLYALKAEQFALQSQQEELQLTLRTLLQSGNTFFITDNDGQAAAGYNLVNLKIADLVDTAYASRYDLKAAQNQIEYSKRNYNLQKALAKPDLTLGAEFDKRGSFVDNASFLTAAIDLPFFKRNQGNIRAAKFSITQSEVMADRQKQTIALEVSSAYAKVVRADQMIRSIDPAFAGQYEKLLEGVTENFQKHNLSLVEFADFSESYRNNLKQANELKNQYQQAMENLQYVVGKPLF